MNPNDDAVFDASRAELFEALGHPTRIRILQALGETPLAFSELKRKTGVQSSGLLSFHLGKLNNLVAASKEGPYQLTDQGKEALRMVRITQSDLTEPPMRVKTPDRRQYIAAIVVLLLALASLSSIALYEAYRPPETSTTTSLLVSTATVTVTSTPVPSASSSTSPAACTIIGPTEGVEIRVVMSNGSDPSHTIPVVGAQVGGEDDGYCNGQRRVMVLMAETTNSSGWASLLDGGFGSYNLSVTYPGSGFVVINSTSGQGTTSVGTIITIFFGGNGLIIPTQPTAITYVTYDTSTGALSWSYRYLA